MAKSLLEPDARTIKRNRSERRFRLWGLTAILIGFVALIFLLSTIILAGFSGFRQSEIELNVHMSKDEIAKAEKSVLKTSAYKNVLSSRMLETLKLNGIETELDEKKLAGLLSDQSGALLREIALRDASSLDRGMTIRFLMNASVDGYLKGRVTRDSIKNNKNITPAQLDLVDQLVEQGLIKTVFNWRFLTNADAGETNPEAAGFGAAMLGSFAMMLVVMLLALPIGVATSIYLEEFAPKNFWTDLIEVNISNLAAVPSIVFGILGMAIFLNFPAFLVSHGFIESSGWLRNNAPFVGGLVLTLMTLPRIVIPTRVALKAVPPSIRAAALGVGASKMQTLFHHVIPLAMPGILTGAIIGLAQALGETAPLLLVGLVGFIGGTMPTGLDATFGGPNTVMPAQIYTWATRADPAWYEKAWAGIIVLLLFLIAMNAIAIILRKKFERRW